MRRRDFITLLGGAATWPTAARARKSALPVIGFTHASTAERNRDVVNAFEDGFKQTGYASGENVAIEYRWANDDYSRLPELVQDLVVS